MQIENRNMYKRIYCKYLGSVRYLFEHFPKEGSPFIGSVSLIFKGDEWHL